MAECAFCDIVAKAPKWVLWHDGDQVVSFKPWGAVNTGHRLFVSVLHAPDAATHPAVTGQVFGEAARWAADKGKPFNLVVNSGAEAGQSVFHLHVHYVPRANGDGLGYRWRREER